MLRKNKKQERISSVKKGIEIGSGRAYAVTFELRQKEGRELAVKLWKGREF